MTVADGTAWRLVSQCASVEDVVRVFRTLASADGLTGIPVSGIGPGGGSTARVVLALSTKAAVLDGEAVVTRDAGTVSVRWTKLDVRGKGLLAHMVEHRAAEAPPAVPRHLVPLGAAAGTPATARGDATMAKCTFEPAGVSGGATPRVPAIPAPASASTPALDVATTVRMPGARQPAPPTLRDAPRSEPPSERPKREMQKTLMGMPALSPARSKPASVPPGVLAPVAAAAPAVMAPHTSSSATTLPVTSAAPVVASGTPPGGLAESAPVPRSSGEAKETGPTRPTRGPRAPSPQIAAAAHALAATPTPYDHVPTLPTAQGAVRRAEAAPSGPVEDVPTVPNEDLATDVSVALPDLPGGDYVDPIVEPPPPAPVHAPVPAPPPAAVYAVAGSSPGWQVPPHAPAPHAPYAAPPMAAMAPQPYYPTPYPGVAPMLVERDDDMTEMVQLVRPGGRRRWPVIAVTSGVIVVGVAVMVILAARGNGGSGETAPPAPAAAVKPPPPPDSKAEAQPPAPTVAEPALPPPPASTTCTVAFSSSPDAADVVLAGKVIGTTPFEHAGSCAAYKVTFRREKYQSVTREVAAGATSLDVRLERPQYKLKVTSRPGGAMVKVGGAELGRTPVTIKLPGHESSTLELVKDGVTTTHRVFPDKNNEKVDVKLKPRRR